MALRDLLIRADSAASLIVHRHRSSVPTDIVADLAVVSVEARALYEALPADIDALAVQVAEARCGPDRYGRPERRRVARGLRLPEVNTLRYGRD